jgi:hypothetical protein
MEWELNCPRGLIALSNVVTRPKDRSSVLGDSIEIVLVHFHSATVNIPAAQHRVSFPEQKRHISGKVNAAVCF